MKKIMIVFFSVIVATAGCLFSSAVDVISEKDYQPLDLVVLLDASGSMATSDQDRTAPAAVRMLVNMMPALDSRVAIISFNEKPTFAPEKPAGSSDLFSLAEFPNLERVRDGIINIKYGGDTGLGNAMKAASDLLQNESDANHRKAIMVFSDGVDEFRYNDPIAFANCAANEADAVKWAKENDCHIYCLAYDYTMPGGKQSQGEEGLSKLRGIAESTGGMLQSIDKIDETEDMLIRFLAAECGIVYKTIETIPGDGQLHQCSFEIGPGVVEANIRIAGGDQDAIKNGKIRLLDNQGREVQLTNNSSTRFDVDAQAASIKLIKPTPGEWTLIVDGVYGDDIEIGVLDHFKITLKSQLRFPDGNPEGVAYAGNEIGIKVWLMEDGADIQNPTLYDSVSSATAVITSRADPDNKRELALVREDLSFAGSFSVEAESYYDILIRVNWDNVYREAKLVVASQNKPVYKVEDIDDVSVNKKKTVEVNNLLRYVADDENDPVTVTVASLSKPDAVDCRIDGDALLVTGKKWTSTLITLEYLDEQGNTVESTFKVHVRDPLAMALIIGGIVLVVCAVLAVLYFAFLKSLRIKGSLYLDKISVYDPLDVPDTMQQYICEDQPIVITMTKLYEKNKNMRNVSGIVRKTMTYFEKSDSGTAEKEIYDYIMTKRSGSALQKGSAKSKLIGTPIGNSFRIRISKGSSYFSVNKHSKGFVSVNDGDRFTFLFKELEGNGRSVKRSIELSYRFVTSVRGVLLRGPRSASG